MPGEDWSTTRRCSRPVTLPSREALTAYVERSGEWYADLVGSFVVTDTALPDVTEDVPVSVVVTGGAGAIGGALGYAAKKGMRVAGLEIALRDLDDLAGNARRVSAAVDAARGEGALDEETPVYVELPQADATPAWLAAADVVAEGEHRLKFRTGGLEVDKFPTPEQLAGWIDAALDRETPFKCTAGLHHAIAHRDHETGFAAPRVPQRAARDAAGLRRRHDRRGGQAAGRPLPQRPGRSGSHQRCRRRPAVVHLVRLVQRRRAARRPGRPGPRRRSGG